MSSEAGAPVEPLACPSCARRFSLDERFCPDCEMPLVYVGRGEEEPITDAHERATKVRPEYIGGELVKVASARNQAEAELLQGMLLEEGIPSMERRMRGFEVPDFLAGGPRDILVPEAAVEAARELLSPVDAGEGELLTPATAKPPAAERFPYGTRLAVSLLAAFIVALAVVWVLYQLAT